MYTSNELRVYAKGSLKVAINNNAVKLTKIVFTLSTQGKKKLAPITVDKGSLKDQKNGDETVTWISTAGEMDVTFTVGDKATFGSDGANKAGQLCFSNATIEYTTDGTGGGDDKTINLTFDPAAGELHAAQYVTLKSSVEGAKIYYTTDGTEPVVGTNEYTTAIPVTISGTTIKALAVAEGYDNATAEATYTIKPDQPVFSAESQTFTSPLKVTLELPKTSSAGSTIHYAIGKTATAESEVYNNGTPIKIEGTTDGENIILHAVVVDEYGNVGKEKYCTYTYESPVFYFQEKSYTVALNKKFDAPKPINTYDDQNVSYSSSDEKVATIDADGNVTLVAVGTTRITATLTSRPEISDYYDLTVKEAEVVDENIDVLTAELFNVGSDNSYSSFANKKSNSSAVYMANVANKAGALQLRSGTSKNSNVHSGIVTTVSGGKVKSIEVEWNSSTTDGRTLDIYGKNTAFSSVEDLYDAANQGTKIGSIKYEKTGEATKTLTLDDLNKFEYIGLRSSDGAMYIDKITIVWETEATLKPTSATLNFVAQNADGYYATFSSDKDVVFTSNVIVYAANVNGTAVKLNALASDLYEVTDATAGESGLLDGGYYVPANTGVLVYSMYETTTTYYFPAETAEVQLPANMLEAATADGVFEGKDGYCYYKLAYNDYTSKTDLGFYYGAADGAPFAVRKGLAYLAVPTTSDAAPARFVLGGDTDAISSVNSDVEKAETVIYTIAGQRVGTATKPGLYIVNGKKLIVK